MIKYISIPSSYGRASSKSRKLPGSTPQGALLGGLIFIVNYKRACLRPAISRPRHVLSPIPPLSLKFVDDHSCAVRIDLKKSLIHDPTVRAYPLGFHERTKHILPSDKNLLQLELNDLKKFIVDNLMKINVSKTKTMSFNSSRNFEFHLS